MTQKTTDEIRTLLNNAKLDFESVENKALNDYLPKIFHSCPFTEELCTTKQCIECAVFTNNENNQNFEAKIQKSK
jgi:xanthine dehydrogenase iron-sulfur cluster and FAD-binding subunit A